MTNQHSDAIHYSMTEKSLEKMSKKYYIPAILDPLCDEYRVWPTDEYRTIVNSRETSLVKEEKERKVRKRLFWFFRRDLWINPILLRCEEVIEHTEKKVMWEDYLPEIKDLKAMCESNPALAIAYEKFKTTYRLVEEKK